MNNKISNPQVKVPTGTSLNDKDYMNNLLGTLKEIVKNYAVILTEVSNETLYNKYKTMFDKYSSLQRQIYEKMFQKGWYSIEKAEENKINEKYQTLNEELTNLNN